MTTVFTFRIDGKDVAGSEGQTVMEVAEENGSTSRASATWKASTIAAPVGCAWSRFAGSPKARRLRA